MNQQAPSPSIHIQWTDELVLEFAKRSQQGSLTGDFEGCKSMVSKLNKFKSMKANDSFTNLAEKIEGTFSKLPEISPGKAKRTGAKPPIIPDIFSIEMSLSHIAATSSEVVDRLDQLVKAINRLNDNSIDSLVRVEKELRHLDRLPANWDAIDGIVHAVDALRRDFMSPPR